MVDLTINRIFELYVYSIIFLTQSPLGSNRTYISVGEFGVGGRDPEW